MRRGREAVDPASKGERAAAGNERELRLGERLSAKNFSPSNHTPVSPISSAASNMPPTGDAYF